VSFTVVELQNRYFGATFPTDRIHEVQTPVGRIKLFASF
jgi:hypothetical protein